MMKFNSLIRLRLPACAILALFVGLVSSQSWAMKDGALDLGIGAFSHNSWVSSTNSSASPGAIGRLYFPVTARYDWQVGQSFFFVPRLLYTPISAEGHDEVKTSFMMLDLDVGQAVWDNWDWTAGISYFRYTVEGPGGTVQLNNGTGTSTFARPARDVTSTTFMFNAGMTRQFDTWDLTATLYFTEIFTSRRTLSGMVGFLYRFNLGGY